MSRQNRRLGAAIEGSRSPPKTRLDTMPTDATAADDILLDRMLACRRSVGCITIGDKGLPSRPVPSAVLTLAARGVCMTHAHPAPDASVYGT